SLAMSGRVVSSRTKFGGMGVPAAQLDLGRPFQEELPCPFDERRQVFVCEDGALVPVGRVVGFALRFETANRRRILRGKFRDFAFRSGTFVALPCRYYRLPISGWGVRNAYFIGTSARFRSGF